MKHLLLGSAVYCIALPVAAFMGASIPMSLNWGYFGCSSVMSFYLLYKGFMDD